MIRPLTRDEEKAFVKSMYHESYVEMAPQYNKMDCEELDELARLKIPGALVELLFREERGELSEDKDTLQTIKWLVMDAVDDIQRDPGRTLRRAFWQIENNIKVGQHPDS